MAATTRILQFIDDSDNGRDISHYLESQGSPIRPHTGSGSGFGKRSSSKSPTRKPKYKPDYGNLQ